jgi:formylmethanofuran dehydrogenase subunit C
VSAYVFRLKKAPPPQRIDLGPLTPDGLIGLSAEQVAGLPVWVAKEQVRVDSLFDIEPGAADQIHIIANGGKLDRIGKAMTQGRIVVEGDAGDYLAQGMKGGELLVRGSCGAFAATTMSGGVVSIEGNAGDCLGSSISGEHAGLRGGLVLVKGNAGDRIGDHQRRGTILIEGDAGNYCGARMGAGTIAVLGTVGHHAGFGMRRGTLLLSRPPAASPAIFYEAGECDLNFLTLLIASWRHLDSRFARLDRLRKRVLRLIGDQACGGKGEILIWIGDITENHFTVGI